MSTIVTTLKAVLDLDDNKFAARLSRSEQALHAFEMRAGRGGSAGAVFGGVLKDIALSAVLAAAAISAITFVSILKGSVAAEEKMRQLGRSFSFVNESYGHLQKDMGNGGSLLDVSKQFSRVSGIARRTGSDLYQIGDAWNKLSVPMFQAGVSVDTVSNSLEGLVVAAKLAGADKIKIERLLTGMSQVAGKGVLQMEELRQQIGEALPSAFVILADGLNQINKETGELGENVEITTGSLRKLVQNQQISAELFARATEVGTREYLKLSEALVYTVEGQAEAITTTWREELAKFGNKSGLYDATVGVISVLDDLLKIGLESMTARWDGAFLNFGTTVGDLYNGLRADLEGYIDLYTTLLGAVMKVGDGLLWVYKNSRLVRDMTRWMSDAPGMVEGLVISSGFESKGENGLDENEHAGKLLGDYLAFANSMEEARDAVEGIGLENFLDDAFTAWGIDTEEFFSKTNADRVGDLTKRMAEYTEQIRLLDGVINSTNNGMPQIKKDEAAKQRMEYMQGIAQMKGIASALGGANGKSNDTTDKFFGKLDEDQKRAEEAVKVRAGKRIPGVGIKDESIIESGFKSTVKRLENERRLEGNAVEAMVAKATDPELFKKMSDRDSDLYKNGGFEDQFQGVDTATEDMMMQAHLTGELRKQSGEVLKKNIEMRTSLDLGMQFQSNLLDIENITHSNNESERQANFLRGNSIIQEETRRGIMIGLEGSITKQALSYQVMSSEAGRAMTMEGERQNLLDNILQLEVSTSLLEKDKVFRARSLKRMAEDSKNSLAQEALSLEYISSADGKRLAVLQGIARLKAQIADSAVEEALATDATAKALRYTVALDGVRAGIRQMQEETERLNDPVFRQERINELLASETNQLAQQALASEARWTDQGKLNEAQSYYMNMKDQELEAELELSRLLTDRDTRDSMKRDMARSSRMSAAQNDLESEFLRDPAMAQLLMEERASSARVTLNQLLSDFNMAWEGQIYDMQIGLMESFTDGVTSGLYGVLTGTMTVASGMLEVFRSMGNFLLKFFIQLAAQRAAFWVAEKLGIVAGAGVNSGAIAATSAAAIAANTAVSSASAISAAALATAWMPAATFASIATFGGAAAAGAAGISAAFASSVASAATASTAMSAISGLAGAAGAGTMHKGGEFGAGKWSSGFRRFNDMRPDEGLAILQKGELVIPRDKVAAMSGAMSGMPVMHDGGTFGMSTGNVNERNIDDYTAGAPHIVNFFDMDEVNRYLIKNPDAVLNVMSKQQRNARSR